MTLELGCNEGTVEGFNEGIELMLGLKEGIVDGFIEGPLTPDGTVDGFIEGPDIPDGAVDGFSDGEESFITSGDLTINTPSSTLLITTTPELKYGYTPHTPSFPLPDLFGVVSKYPTSSSTPSDISDRSNIRSPAL